MSISLTPDIETQNEAVRDIAARLVGVDVSSAELIGGGRNSRVYRIVDADGRSFALKAYFRHETDNRDRLNKEFQGLEFLWCHGVRNVPRPLVADRQAGYALYEYIEGQCISRHEISPGDVTAAADFLGTLHELASQPESEPLPRAAEAFFSGDELLANLRERLDRLWGPENQRSAHPAFQEFMQSEYLPALEQITAWSRAHWPFDRELPRTSQTLSPSDFGFHNAIRRDSGAWVFVDFEYFGWDDPAKMLSDFILHPAMELTSSLKRHFLRNMMGRFAGEPSLGERLRAFYPLFGLKWCMILLNEFLPEHFMRRQFAAGKPADREVIEAAQLAKAHRMLDQVCRDYEHFPYLDP